MKTSSNYLPPTNLNLTIYSHIKQGRPIKQICAILNLSKSAISYHIKALKLLGYIKKVGYGVWETTSKQVQIHPIGTLTSQGGSTILTSLPSDTIRSHAYQWTISLKNIINWENRQGFLSKQGIPYKQIQHNVQRIVYKGHKVWLSDKSITFYIKKEKSYIGKTPEQAYEIAINDFFDILHGLENLLKVSFKQNNGYKFKCDKKHHSLIKNALAKQYNDEKKKLKVVDDNGLWLIIDDSFNLNELECVRTPTNNNEATIVQTLFNGVVKYNLSVEFILESFNKINETLNSIINIQMNETKKMSFYNDNLVKHIEVLDNLGKNVEVLGQGVKENTETIKELKNIVKQPYQTHLYNVKVKKKDKKQTKQIELGRFI